MGWSEVGVGGVGDRGISLENNNNNSFNNKERDIYLYLDTE